MIALAWTMLVLWPFVSIVFFATMRLPVALCATLLGGYLLLPSQISVDLPVLPALDKHSVPALTALLFTAIMMRRQDAWPTMPGWVPRHPVALVCLGFLLVMSFGTALTNGDSLVFGPRHVTGLRMYDAFSIGLGFLMILIPFVLGRKVFSSIEGQRLLLICLIAMAVVYAFPALFEVRMSPRLNKMIYGFFSHSWIQHIRGGGFRPLVFLDHGLWLGIFFTSAALAAFALVRHAKTPFERALFLGSGLWIFFTILLSKVFGALLILLTLLPICLFFPKRLQVLALASIACVVLIYPMMRAVDLVPTGQIVAFAQNFSDERAGSLQFRVDNEDQLLERASQRPIFGWGGFSRNEIFDERGRNRSTTDGYWIIIFGQNGWLGYLGTFGLLTAGAILLFRERPESLHPYSIAIGFALVGNLVDLLPNAGTSPLTWMMAGALLGRLEPGAERDVEDTPEVEARARPTLRREFSDTPGVSAPVYRRDLGPNKMRAGQE